MRVIAGKYRSRRLKTVDSSLTRPTTDKNKENLFNMIGPYFEGGNCLDLFAGSGGLGIEAMSRGMDTLYSVDKQYKAYQVIRENLRDLNISHAYAYEIDYRKALEKFKDMGLSFDLVLLDPPYSMKINDSIIHYLLENHMLNDHCIIVLEDKIEEALTFSEPFYLYKQQTYGITILQIIKYKGENS